MQSPTHYHHTSTAGGRGRLTGMQPCKLPGRVIKSRLPEEGGVACQVWMWLLAGQPIKMVALGGSVTKNHGPIRKENAYLPRLFAWINETFPHPDHQLINHAIPAVPQTPPPPFPPSPPYLSPHSAFPGNPAAICGRPALLCTPNTKATGMLNWNKT